MSYRQINGNRSMNYRQITINWKWIQTFPKDAFLEYMRKYILMVKEPCNGYMQISL